MYNFSRDLYGEFSAARADVIFWQELYRRVNLSVWDVLTQALQNWQKSANYRNLTYEDQMP